MAVARGQISPVQNIFMGICRSQMSTRTSRSAAAEKRSLKGSPASKQPAVHPLVTCRISVFWEGENKFFKGQIIREVRDAKQSNNALYHVEYDDGEAHDEDLRNDRFRWHGPRATSAVVPYHKEMRPAMLDLEAENVHGDKENDPGTIALPKGGVPVLSEAVGWRIGFWWEGTRDWVDAEVLSYRASDARHLVVFADGECEWMSLAVETIRWVGNTRERGARLKPLSFGLDPETNPPKGREAVDWVVDVFDKNIKQMQRLEISGFDSVTGKHKTVSSESRKVSWISLTASKIVWRFPPGLPPTADAVNTAGVHKDGVKDEAARQGSMARASPTVQGKPHHKTKGPRQKRKIGPAVSIPDATAPEGSAAVSPSAGRGSKKGGFKMTSAGGKGVAAPKGMLVKPKSPIAAVPPKAPDVKLAPLVSATPVVPSKRTAEAAIAPAQPAKRKCSIEETLVVATSTAAAELSAQAAEAAVADASRRRRSACAGPVAQPLVHGHSLPPDAPRPAGLSQTDARTAHVMLPRDLPGPSSVASVKPAPIRPVGTSHVGMREAAFVRSSLAPAVALQKHPDTFNGSVQCLLAATERRQQFVRALMKHLGDSNPPHATAVPMATPPLRPGGSLLAVQNATLMTIPTDPRRVSRPQVVDDPSKTAPTPQAGATPAAPPQPVKHAPQSLPAQLGAAPAAAVLTAPLRAAHAAGLSSQNAVQTTPASQHVAARKTPLPGKQANVAQFTPKFAPLSSFQRGHSVLGAAPVTLPAVAPDSKTVQEMLKQRSPADAATQAVTLSMSMVAKAVSAPVPSAVQQVVRSPPSDQTSSSSKVDDIKCASAAKAGIGRQQQAARVSAATWQVSQMQNAGSQKQGMTANSKCDVHTESRNSGAHVQEAGRGTTLNRTVSSNVRTTANLRWGGAPLVAARASIGLKGGSSGAGSTGGRACG
eukprot:jgi/Ulvmu1/1274/UM109_0072.1